MKFLPLLLLLTACSAKSDIPAEQPKKKASFRDVQGEFRAKKYPINEAQSITIFDVPDRIAAHRCWVFTDEKINQSHMRCDSDPTPELPDYAGSLEK